jgi:putrescine N-hydroxylase
MNDEIYDFVGIGVGPFNLGLACLSDPIAELNCLFLDKRDSFNWHPGMLLQDSTLQIPFLADLVTLADPTSPFSFLNYVKEQGRIYSFYIRQNFYLLRNEFNRYCQWAVSKLSNIHFNKQVVHIDYCEEEQCYLISTVCNTSGKPKIYRGKKLVLGTGTVPYLPACCRDLSGEPAHSASYLDHKQRLQGKKSITVIGSGQSAAEIYFDLLQDIDKCGYELNWITRSPRFFPLEYSKLTLEMTSPEYVDYFYALPSRRRDQLLEDHKHLYKGIDNKLINEIYDLLYTKSLTTDVRVTLCTNSELKRAEFNEADDCFELEFYQHEQGKYYKCSTEGVVLATGYVYRLPGFIEGISSRIKWDERGRFDVNRNYSIDKNCSEVFVQNAELHTHGFVTPDLGMACYRNSYIIKEMTGKEYYPIERKIAFQQFTTPEEKEEIIEPIDFVKQIPGLGDFHLRSLQVPGDIPLIHDWVTRDYAKYWGMQGKSIKEVEAAYVKILEHSQVLMGFHNNKAAFLLERYWPMEDEVGKYYDVQPGDHGMHILVAPADQPISNFTWQVFTVIIDFIFSDERVKRIVVEPDVRNEKIHILNKRAGFEYQKIIELPNKRAYLGFCTREQYLANRMLQKSPSTK